MAHIHIHMGSSKTKDGLNEENVNATTVLSSLKQNSTKLGGIVSRSKEYPRIHLACKKALALVDKAIYELDGSR